ncbi:MAG: hypothetical protein QOH56_45 [Pseudonocardiales bacterium]|nr:hypothetical protein [Pseudonocardiales bacterium]
MSPCPFAGNQGAGPKPTYPAPPATDQAPALPLEPASDSDGIVNDPPSRRTMLRVGIVAAAVAALSGLDLAAPVQRQAFAAPPVLPDIQFAIGSYLAPAVRITEAGAPTGGTMFGFGPVYTLFLTAKLTRMPTKADRLVLEQALRTVEAHYAFSASGVFSHISYGVPYFNKLPGGIRGPLVSKYLPKLIDDHTRQVLEEAVPGPTDVHPSNPAISKPRFNVPVQIEGNDVLITLRSDLKDNLYDVRNWLFGSSVLKKARVPAPAFNRLFTWTSSRLMFGGRGLPRKIADAEKLPYASYVHPDSPMWMGFADMVADAFGPPAICTFQGNRSARLTTETGTGYFANSSIQVLNHVILDLEEWYLTNGSEILPRNGDVTYLERAQYMYRPNDPPAFGRADQFTDGGGPTFLPNVYQGADDARNGCMFGSYQPGVDTAAPGVNSAHKILGHISTLQRSSRAADGTPLHIRVDGPGYDAMDVPDGSNQPKLHFSALVPTADLFRRMRISQASADLAEEFRVERGDQGLEHRITATRRQNFLMPRRRNRSFPLLELVPGR